MMRSMVDCGIMLVGLEDCEVERCKLYPFSIMENVGMCGSRVLMLD